MDRNLYIAYGQALVFVAPLAGSVDRNSFPLGQVPNSRVAPLAGSVDRNSVGIEDATELLGRSPRGERG